MFLNKDRIENPPKLTDNVIAIMIVVLYSFTSSLENDSKT